MEFEAVIFDCDGTLTDSMPTHYLTWKKVMSDAGGHFPEHRFYELAGVPADKVAKIIAEENGIEIDITSVVEQREVEFDKLAGQVEPFQEVIDLADQFRKRIPIAVGSGSIRRSVEAQLRGLGIIEWFSAIVCAEDTERHKPEPDVFLEAARRLGVSPNQCCVYEDGDLGIQAAQRAGMNVVDVRKLRN